MQAFVADTRAGTIHPDCSAGTWARTGRHEPPERDAMTVQRLKNYVNGTWVAPKVAEVHVVRNPATGEAIGETPLCGADEVDAAVRAAAAAFPKWRAVPVQDRVQYLFKLKALLDQHLEELAAGDIGTAYYFMLTWLPLLLVKQHGFSVSGMAVIGFCVYALQAVSTPLAGWLCDRAIAGGARAGYVLKTTMNIGLGGVALAMAVCAIAGPKLVVALVIVTGVFFGLQSAPLGTITQTLGGERASAQWMGIQNFCANLAGVLAPLLTGIAVDRSGQAGGREPGRVGRVERVGRFDELVVDELEAIGGELLPLGPEALPGDIRPQVVGLVARQEHGRVAVLGSAPMDVQVHEAQALRRPLLPLCHEALPGCVGPQAVAAGSGEHVGSQHGDQKAPEGSRHAAQSAPAGRPASSPQFSQFWMMKPPSTGSATPFRNEAEGSTSASVAWATSSGSP